MSFKFKIILGKYIQRLNHSELPSNFWIELFPELSKEIRYVYQPQHVNDTLRYVCKTLDKAMQQYSEAENLEDVYDNLAIITHSSQVVNYIGNLIAEGYINASDVEVWMFNGENPRVSVPDKVFTFDSDGVLQNWKYGWFDVNFLDEPRPSLMSVKVGVASEQNPKC